MHLILVLIVSVVVGDIEERVPGINPVSLRESEDGNA